MGTYFWAVAFSFVFAPGVRPSPLTEGVAALVVEHAEDVLWAVHAK
jgi:hypothetical protein